MKHHLKTKKQLEFEKSSGDRIYLPVLSKLRVDPCLLGGLLPARLAGLELGREFGFEPGLEPVAGALRNDDVDVFRNGLAYDGVLHSLSDNESGVPADKDDRDVLGA